MIKTLAVQFLFYFCRIYLRYIPVRFGKGYLWHKVCRPYLNWRDINITVTASSGVHIKSNVMEFIQQRLIYFGVWEPNLTSFITRRLKEGDIFIDIGANIGYYSVIGANLVGSQGSVVAIEASPSIFGMLQETIQLNKLSNVRSINCAVSEKEGSVTLYKAPNEITSRSTISPERGYAAECEVPGTPLMRIVCPDELRRARLIKIDIEGAELPVLREILENIQLFGPRLEIVSEISSHLDDETAVVKLFDGFAKCGFNAYELPNDYSPEAYFDLSVIEAPVRIENLPPNQFDVVFSRATTYRL